MTPLQKTRLEGFQVLADTATFADLRTAIGAEVLFLSSIQETQLFIQAFRIAEKNSPDQTGEEISIILSEALRKELNLISRGADMINNFFAWLEKSQATG